MCQSEQTDFLSVLQMKRLLGMEMIEKGLLEEMGLELNLKPWATDGGTHFWEVPKTAFRFSMVQWFTLRAPNSGGPGFDPWLGN